LPSLCSFYTAKKPYHADSDFALEAPTVVESWLAQELEEKYCNPEDQSSIGESDGHIIS